MSRFLKKRKVFGQDPPGTRDSSTTYEQKFRETLFKDYADSCSDTLPQNGPAACLPGEPQHKVKLKLKEGAQIRSKKPYRIPEVYRDDL
jgi:hypothetical protein